MENFTVFIAKHMGLFYIFASALVVLLFVEFIRTRRGQARLRPAEAVLMINKQNAAVIDVRNLDSFRKGHIVDAHSMPLKEISESNKKLEKFRSKPLIVVDGNGLEAQKAAATLAKLGYNAFILAGGMRAWSEADLPLVKE
jgi:rhodanese-related sulfurtransferase